MQDLTQTQKQMIGLAESAEAYIKAESRNQATRSTGSVQTKSGLENRASKRKRIQQAKRGYQ